MELEELKFGQTMERRLAAEELKIGWMERGIMEGRIPQLASTRKRS